MKNRSGTYRKTRKTLPLEGGGEGGGGVTLLITFVLVRESVFLNGLTEKQKNTRKADVLFRASSGVFLCI